MVQLLHPYMWECVVKDPSFVVKDPLKNNFHYFIDPYCIKYSKSESLGKNDMQNKNIIFLLLDLADLIKLLQYFFSELLFLFLPVIGL